MKLPYRKMEKTFHVGTFDITSKDYTGYEGYTLSVSPCPDDWRWIARLSGDDYKLTKDGGLFVDYYELTDDQKEAIYAWGVTNGYVYEDTAYKYTFYDSERDENVFMLFQTYEKAFYESGEDDEAISGETVYMSNDKMNTFMNHEVSMTNVFAFLLIMYVDLNTTFDGVYWDDNLDRYSYSAPRGGIVPRAMSSWTIELAEEGEWEETEWEDEDDE